MKKVIVLVLTLAIGTSSLFASNGDPEPSNKKLRFQIENCLQKASVYIDEEIDVEIHFTFTSDAQMVITKLIANDENLKEFICKKLNNKKFLQAGKRGKIYKIQLKFKPMWSI